MSGLNNNLEKRRPGKLARRTWLGLCSFRLPENLFVANLRPTRAAEIADHTSGRTANKGMEGLAITPDGKTLVGIVQASLIQDAAEGDAASKVLRLVSIDVETGKATHEYAYLLTTGSGERNRGLEST